MIPDSPIVADIRKIRMEISSRFDHDANKYADYLLEKYGNEKYVRTATSAGMTELERKFHQAMLELYQKAKDELHYNASRFLKMLGEHGGLATARKLIHAPEVSEGFTKLWEHHRLDLAVEALILKPEWQSLFTDDEKEIASRRLEKYEYQFEPEHSFESPQ